MSENRTEPSKQEKPTTGERRNFFLVAIAGLLGLSVLSKNAAMKIKTPSDAYARGRNFSGRKDASI